MDRGQALAVWLLCCWGSVRVVTGLHRSDLFPYGSLSGDLILAEGDDETSKVLTLPRPLRFYDAAFAQLYVSETFIVWFFQVSLIFVHSGDVQKCQSFCSFCF
uniref:Secreted protein n=1 Tax=Periophthalmus magnuspinnatus TaxID=409849 RepID=A0A3B4AC68_9GOBI